MTYCGHSYIARYDERIRFNGKTNSRWATGVPRAPPPPPGQSQIGIKMTVWISSFRIEMFPSK